MGAFSLVAQDIAPYVRVHGNHAIVKGINTEGLKRRGFSKEDLGVLKGLYKTYFLSTLTASHAVQSIHDQFSADHPIVREFCKFLDASTRGVCRKVGISLSKPVQA